MKMHEWVGALLLAAANNTGARTMRPIPDWLVGKQVAISELLRRLDVHFNIAEFHGNLSLTIIWSPTVESAAKRYLRGEGIEGTGIKGLRE